MAGAKPVSEMTTEELEAEHRLAKEMLFFLYYGNIEPSESQVMQIARDQEVVAELRARSNDNLCTQQLN